MDRIHYAGASVVTGTEIARALLDYAQALAQAETSDTVDIPVLQDDGATGRWEVLVGPASQVASESLDGDGHDDKIVDDVLVARLHRQADRLRKRGTPTAVAVEEAPFDDGAPSWTDYDNL